MNNKEAIFKNLPEEYKTDFAKIMKYSNNTSVVEFLRKYFGDAPLKHNYYRFDLGDIVYKNNCVYQHTEFYKIVDIINDKNLGYGYMLRGLTSNKEIIDFIKDELVERANNINNFYQDNSLTDISNYVRLCKTWYSNAFGDGLIYTGMDENEYLHFLSNHNKQIKTTKYGTLYDDAKCVIWPSKELYELYPLDPMLAWEAFRMSAN